MLLVQDGKLALEDKATRYLPKLQGCKLDRSLLTSDADTYFALQVLADVDAGLKPLGNPQSFRQASVELRGGMTYWHFEIGFRGKSLHLSTCATPDGKLAQYLIQ